ncbi:MAG: hypothetical protein HZC02_04415 [Candidatus Levybacteria bacterium]|nr:hypothetical protein [Candidatus Levybacteria bacterium]
MPTANYPLWLYVVGLWSLVWKGIALWRSSKNDQKLWFVAILVINTVGIVEIIYLFKFAKKKLTIEEIKSWKKFLKKSN